MKKQLLKESGIRNITQLAKNYPKAKIYFHQDLDGVTSALAMKKYLESYGVEVIDAEITQYGPREFAVKKPKFGEKVMAVLVDFAHGKDWFTIHTDHHDSQTGVKKDTSTSFKHARSNVETLSQDVSPKDIFIGTDIKLIKIVDSADFLANNLTTKDVINYIHKFDKGITFERNKILKGLTINKILLAFKGAKLPDGINFLERLVMECEPSMTSIYNKMMQLILDYGLMKKIEPIIRQEFLETAEEIQDEKRKRELEIRAIEKQLQKNKDVYLQQVRASEKTSLLPLGEPQTDADEERLVGSIASIAVKEGAGGGNMSVKGAYDRYAAFEKYENEKNPPDFQLVTWTPVGLLQVSCNPYKKKVISNVDLGAMKDKILEEERSYLEPLRVTVADLKYVAESDKSFVPGESVGFRKDDLLSFYNETVEGLDSIPENFKTDSKEFQPGKFSNVKSWQNYITKLMDKPYKDLKGYEKNALNSVTVSVFEVIKKNSGGHPCITNFQVSPLGQRIGSGPDAKPVKEYLPIIKEKFLQKLGKLIGLGGKPKTTDVNENYFRDIIKKVIKG
jgi:hypothetical protein